LQEVRKTVPSGRANCQGTNVAAHKSFSLDHEGWRKKHFSVLLFLDGYSIIHVDRPYHQTACQLHGLALSRVASKIIGIYLERPKGKR
jgi:hypothetical protein